jgi:hypothetical protein
VLLDPTIRETSDGGTRSLSLSPTTRTRWFSAVWGRIWDKSPGKALIAARRRASSPE